MKLIVVFSPVASEIKFNFVMLRLPLTVVAGVEILSIVAFARSTSSIRFESLCTLKSANAIVFAAPFTRSKVPPYRLIVFNLTLPATSWLSCSYKYLSFVYLKTPPSLTL